MDILVNNAASLGEIGDAVSQHVKPVNVNYTGTKNLSVALLPLLRIAGQGSRIVNVTAGNSLLEWYSPEIRGIFLKPDLSLSELDSLTEKFLVAATMDKLQDFGFNCPSYTGYAFSKACVNALTGILARMGASEGIVANCCCPGWTDTRIGRAGGKAPKTPAEGAVIPVRLAVGDIGQVTGCYWSNPSIMDTEDGQLQEWSSLTLAGMHRPASKPKASSTP